jgi:hypothetical protein
VRPELIEVNSMKRVTTFSSVAFAVLAMLVSARPAQAQQFAFSLREPIEFHGARLVGFQGGIGLRIATGVVQPSDPSLVFLTIKIEIDSPFRYVPGRFREITLTDEDGHAYWYRGWLTDEGWIQIDDPDVDIVTPMEAEEYPAIFGLTFEVPAAVRRLELHYGTTSATLFSLPER